MKQFRWYGWGSADRTYSFEERPRAWQFICSALNLNGDEKYPPCDFDHIELCASRVDLKALHALAHTETSKYIRVFHGYGKSYRDLIRLRRGEIFNPPDAVIYPDDEDQVQQIIRYCAANDYALIPFGGGSSVVGGVEPRDRRIVISLDLKRMSRVLEMDALAQVASIEPGIWGPELENYLNARGWTLGHFPQSFEFSTLGGWIATRSAGFASTKYGTIETMTLGLRMATPAGMIETQSAQENSVGPSLLQLLIGSEGTLGVITRATMRIRALSKIANYRAMLFGTFADGVAAVRDIVQSDLAPATIQLLDEEDTRCFFAFRKQARGLQGLVETTESRMLSTLGKSIEQGALLILGFEGDAYTVKVTENHVLAICQDHGAFDLGARIAHAWFRDRFESPYLRDALMDHGVMMDTFETATTWGNLELGYQKLTHALSQAAQEVGARILVLTHLSQCRREGATLGVTFLAPITPHQEINHWEHIQRAAIECSIDHGGAIAPHSGVGYEYAFWLQQKLGALGYDTLLSLKKRLDPKNIMNPGKLFLPA